MVSKDAPSSLISAFLGSRCTLGLQAGSLREGILYRTFLGGTSEVTNCGITGHGLGRRVALR